jgi:hypothetical protein
VPALFLPSGNRQGRAPVYFHLMGIDAVFLAKYLYFAWVEKQGSGLMAPLPA